MVTNAEKIIQVLDALKSGGLKVGAEWRAAHELAQAHEGIPDFDWLHALCHRIEGDESNANYWYRRAGRQRCSDSIEVEWSRMRQAHA